MEWKSGIGIVWFTLTCIYYYYQENAVSYSYSIKHYLTFDFILCSRIVDTSYYIMQYVLSILYLERIKQIFAKKSRGSREGGFTSTPFLSFPSTTFLNYTRFFHHILLKHCHYYLLFRTVLRRPRELLVEVCLVYSKIN